MKFLSKVTTTVLSAVGLAAIEGIIFYSGMAYAKSTASDALDALDDDDSSNANIIGDIVGISHLSKGMSLDDFKKKDNSQLSPSLATYNKLLRKIESDEIVKSMIFNQLKRGEVGEKILAAAIAIYGCEGDQTMMLISDKAMMDALIEKFSDKIENETAIDQIEESILREILSAQFDLPEEEIPEVEVTETKTVTKTEKTVKEN